MSIFLDRNDPDTTVALPFVLPSSTLGSITMEFISDYDRQTSSITSSFTQRGDFLLVPITRAQLPRRDGNYTVSVSDTVGRSLSLSDITQSLSEITATLLTLSGTGSTSILGRLAAVIATSITQQQQQAVDSATIQPAETNASSIQQQATDETIIQTVATDSTTISNSPTNARIQSI